LSISVSFRFPCLQNWHNLSFALPSTTKPLRRQAVAPEITSALDSWASSLLPSLLWSAEVGLFKLPTVSVTWFHFFPFHSLATWCCHHSQQLPLPPWTPLRDLPAFEDLQEGFILAFREPAGRVAFFFPILPKSSLPCLALPPGMSYIARGGFPYPPSPFYLISRYPRKAVPPALYASRCLHFSAVGRSVFFSPKPTRWVSWHHLPPRIAGSSFEDC